MDTSPIKISRKRSKCLDPRTPKGEFAQVSLAWTSRPFRSSPEPLYENEVKCSAFDTEMIVHSHVNFHFHFSQERLRNWPHFESEGFGTRKWPVEQTSQYLQ